MNQPQDTKGSDPTTEADDVEFQKLRNEIIASLANDYYEQLKNDTPYINMTFEETGGACKDFAEQDMQAIETHYAAKQEQAVMEARMDELETIRGFNENNNDHADIYHEVNDRLAELRGDNG